MNAAAVNMSAPMGAAGGFAGGARGYAAGAGGEVEAPKEISTEQIQGMLDDNSKLIVEIIELNNQIKAGKGTAQLGELTDKLDKKRKQLNKNLMTLAKWADDSAETPRTPAPAPTPAQQQQQQMYAASQAQMQAAQYARAGMGGMGQMPASMAQMQQAQMQARYSQAQAHAQAQAQAQALAQAQYQARLNSMGAMNPYGQMGMQQQQQQQRYVDSSMGYSAAGGMQQMNPMRMAGGMPQGYADPQAAAMRAQQMGFTVGPQGYGMMPPPQAQQRLSPGAQGMTQGMQQGGAMGVSMGMPHQQQQHQGMSPGAQQQQQQHQQQQQQQPMMVSMPMSSMPMAPSEGPASSS